MMKNIKDNSRNDSEKMAVGKYYASIIENNKLIGIGTGSTIKYFIEEFGKRVKKEKLDIDIIPTSYQSEYRIYKSNMKSISSFQQKNIDIAIDGADQVTLNFFAIKGYGGAQLKEKIVAYSSNKFVILVDESKISEFLNIPVPIEVHPFGINFVISKLKKYGGIPKLRIAKMKDGPVITDNGNFVLDCDFGLITNPNELDLKISKIPGVISHGLFHHISEIYVG